MANILSKESREVLVYEFKWLEGVKCDICGKVIPTSNFRKPESEYFEVTTGHHDWGSESCESIEYKDVCPECISKFFQEYLQSSSDHPTAYIEVEKKQCYRREVRV